MKVLIVARAIFKLRNPGAKKACFGASARGDPDASPTPDKANAQHISTCVPPPPVACPQLPPNPTPPKVVV